MSSGDDLTGYPRTLGRLHVLLALTHRGKKLTCCNLICRSPTKNDLNSQHSHSTSENRHFELPELVVPNWLHI